MLETWHASPLHLGQADDVSSCPAYLVALPSFPPTNPAALLAGPGTRTCRLDPYLMNPSSLFCLGWAQGSPTRLFIAVHASPLRAAWLVQITSTTKSEHPRADLRSGLDLVPSQDFALLTFALSLVYVQASLQDVEILSFRPCYACGRRRQR